MKKSPTSKAIPAPLIQRVEFSFGNQPFHSVTHLGSPWFFTAHACNALGLSNSRKAVSALDADEKAEVTLSYTSSNGTIQRRKTSIISESGLYTLILRSRGATKPGTRAHRFRKWVTAEVLPTVRETGRFETSAGSAAWALTQIARNMPWARVLELLHPLRAYGSPAANGLPRTGFRRAAFIAAPHRTAAAADFREHAVLIKFFARQLELPFTGGGAHD